jgi:hypothetical protein
MGDKNKGLYNKFYIGRADGRSGPGEKHYQCEYFVLDLTHDKYSIPALMSYVFACKDEYPKLATDLLVKISSMKQKEDISLEVNLLRSEIKNLYELTIHQEKQIVDLRQQLGQMQP